MKVWQIDPANLTPYYNIALCQALAAEGHSLHYITSKYVYDRALTYPSTFTTDLHYFKLLENEGLLRTPIVRKGLRAISYPADHLRLLAKLAVNQPDVVHFQWSRLPIFDQWLVSSMKRRGIPTVHTIHDVNPLFSQGRFTGHLKDVYARIDALIVHTQDSRTRLLQSLASLDPTSVHVIPHLALPDRYAPPDASQALARSRLNIAPDAFVVLFFGAVKHYKGVDILRESLALVPSGTPTLQFWIVGRPETADDAQLLADLRSTPNVHVHAYYVPADVVWQYHLAADVVVFPYRDIFQSGALITTLGYGRAVIVTDVGGLWKWLIATAGSCRLKTRRR